MEYRYRARVLRNYDGDTLTVEIDLGFGVFLSKQTIRLYGVDTPEIRGEEREAGLLSKEYVQKLTQDTSVEVQTLKTPVKWKGKYGRWLAIVWLLDSEGNPVTNLNESIVTEGFGERINY